MSGFIPMVSTTPPPIDDDDDFGDFMDSSHPERDDFGDVSSPIDYDDYSYPSLNSPPDITKSISFPSEDEDSLDKPPDNIFGGKVKDDTTNDKVSEVETILTKAKSNINEEDTREVVVVEDNLGHIPNCNGTLLAVVPHLTSGPDISPAYVNDSKSEDWMDFEDAPPKPSNDMQDSIEPENTMPASSHTFHGSPEPDQPPLNGTDSPTKDNTSDCEVPDFSNFENDQIPQDLPSSENDDFQANTECTAFTETKENLDESSPKCKSENSSDIEDLTLTETDKVKLDSEKYQSELSSGPKTDDVATSYTEARTTVGAEGQEPDYADSKSGISVDSGEEEGHNINFSVFGNSESQTVEDSQDFDAEFNDFESPRGTIDQNISVETNHNIEQSDTKNLEPDAFAAFESSETQTPKGDLHFNPDFADFQSSATGNNDDDDFGDFDSAFAHSSDVTPSENTGKVASPPVKQPQNDSNFAAFEKANDSDDGFADFSDPPSSDQTTKEAEFGDFSTGDDDFAGFSSGSASTLTSSITVTKKPSLNDKVASYVSKYITMSEDESPCEVHTPHLDEHFSTDMIPASKGSGSPSTASVESMGIVWPGDLWDQLEDIDNAIALNFLWNGSGHNKHLLDSLGMHTQNILFSGAKQAYYVPAYYAAGLGLIDPSKGILKPMSAAEKITAMSPTDKNFPATQDDVLTEEPHPEWKTIADEHGSGNGMNVDGSWLRNGQVLSNHTGAEIDTNNEPVPIISSAMDLDFFDSLPSVRVGVKPTSSTDLIDPELLELTSAPTTEPPAPPKDSGSATLSRILASIKSSNNAQSASTVTPTTAQDNSKWEEEENKLGAEARSVLRRLPDLSYMRAKVLMFPINMSRVNIGDD